MFFYSAAAAACDDGLMFHLCFRAFCFLTGNATNCFSHTFNEGKGHGSICAAPLTNALLFLILAVNVDNVFIVIRAGRVRQFELIANSSRTFFPHSTNRDMEKNAMKLTLAYPNMIIRTRTTLMWTPSDSSW